MESRQIIHVDMDAFYASVEQHDNPALKGKPVIVAGSPASRGVVSAASYEARTFGVHSAMPASQAHRLCPNGVFLPVRMSRYVDVSRQIRTIFHRYTPDVEPLSVDEAFLDVTGCIKLFGSADMIGRRLKDDIKAETGLIASVGIAENKFLAKLASDLDKPDGFVLITPENKQAVLDPLDIRRIWGIGKVTAQALRNAGIQTIAHLRQADPKALTRILGNQTAHILDLSQGIDNRPVEPYTQAKSISAEQTFAADIADKDTLLAVLLTQTEEIAQRLRAEGLQGRTVTLKIRYGDFKTLTRSTTLDQPTDITQTLRQEAQKLFSQWHKTRPGALRLLGVGISNLSAEGSGQKMLFDAPRDEKQKKLDSAFDSIRKKYGDNSLKHGSP